jgi:hypothetical protein
VYLSRPNGKSRALYVRRIAEDGIKGRTVYFFGIGGAELIEASKAVMMAVGYYTALAEMTAAAPGEYETGPTPS